ncbi:MAG TPA: protoporphyrinogen oxidase [Methylomirabilota bacterium]|nr:protoporphyrinogen oxidase [Methylomirabilota bacterium]
MAERRPRVVVVGGGIAGLASGYLVRELARERGLGVDLSVLEAALRHGGSTRTDHVDGYTCEWGPNGFLDNEPATLDLVERIGLKDSLVAADETSANRYIFHGGRMRRVPTSPPAFLASDILPLGAKLRMALEVAVPAKRDGADETVDAFGRRRLGRRFAQMMLDPMVSGIFAGDTTRLSLAAVFPKMVEMEREHGGLFRALIAKRRAAKRAGTTAGGPAGPNAVLHTFTGGMGRLTDRLAELLGGALGVASPVTAVEPIEHGRFRVVRDGGAITTDAVILAVPSFAAARLIAGLDPSTAEALAAIEHAPVDVVCHGHPAEHLSDPLSGFGVLIPRSEGIRSLGTLWSDAIFPGQAPPGRRLLRTILGGAHDPGITGLSVDELHATAAADHATVMGVHGEPEMRTEFRFARGIAQYTVGHLERVRRSERLEDELPGLLFTGASYRGVSINGCTKDAFRVARRLVERLVAAGS